MTRFSVQVTFETMTAVQVDAQTPEAAMVAALSEIKQRDPLAEPVIASVLDPDDLSGNGMPLTEWFAE